MFCDLKAEPAKLALVYTPQVNPEVFSRFEDKPILSSEPACRLLRMLIDTSRMIFVCPSEN